MFVLYRIDETGVDVIACSRSTLPLREHPRVADRLDDWEGGEDGEGYAVAAPAEVGRSAGYYIVPCEEVD